MEELRKLDTWHKTPVGHVVFGVLELVIAYGAISLAIDRGSVPLYFIGFLALYGAIGNFLKAIHRSVRHYGKKSRAKR